MNQDNLDAEVPRPKSAPRPTRPNGCKNPVCYAGPQDSRLDGPDSLGCGEVYCTCCGWFIRLWDSG
jgi:hypothetical protein